MRVLWSACQPAAIVETVFPRQIVLAAKAVISERRSVPMVPKRPHWFFLGSPRLVCTECAIGAGVGGGTLNPRAFGRFIFLFRFQVVARWKSIMRIFKPYNISML